MGWALVVVVVIGLMVVIPHLNRKTCARAFARGMQDAERPFLEIARNYAEYFAPLRPMDAAAYRLGVAFMARAIVGLEMAHPKVYFDAAWEHIVEGGTAVRHLVKLMGVKHAAALFSLPLGEEIMAVIEEDYALSPVQALSIAIARKDGKPPEDAE
jgi:hypothetical protein